MFNIVVCNTSFLVKPCFKVKFLIFVLNAKTTIKITIITKHQVMIQDCLPLNVMKINFENKARLSIEYLRHKLKFPIIFVFQKYKLQLGIYEAGFAD